VYQERFVSTVSAHPQPKKVHAVTHKERQVLGLCAIRRRKILPVYHLIKPRPFSVVTSSVEKDYLLVHQDGPVLSDIAMISPVRAMQIVYGPIMNVGPLPHPPRNFVCHQRLQVPKSSVNSVKTLLKPMVARSA